MFVAKFIILPQIYNELYNLGSWTGWPREQRNRSKIYHDVVINCKLFPRYWPLCAGNSLVIGEFPLQRPVTRRFDVFFDLRRNGRSSKQSWGWWFETPSPYDVIVMIDCLSWRRVHYKNHRKCNCSTVTLEIRQANTKRQMKYNVLSYYEKSSLICKCGYQYYISKTWTNMQQASG